jgi:Restriction endonuclease
MPPLIEQLSRNLLWVDDDGPQRFPYEVHILEKRGWVVTWVTTTADAARFLATEYVDGVVTDIIHPLTENSVPSLWGGYHLIKWLRDERRGNWGDMKQIPSAIERYWPLDGNQHLPILVASSFFDEEIQDRIRKLPRSAELSWLPKPLDDEKLIAFVEALELTRSARRSDAPQSSVAPVIEEIEPAWDALRRYLARNPSYLHQMNPRKFEQLVAEIFRDFGWEVELTSSTRDGGYDIIAIRRDWSSQLRLLVEAKRFSPERKVDVGIVRSLYGVKSSVAASQAILATSSYVSKDVRREFAHVIPWELDFLERDKILAWCAQADPALLRSGGAAVEG